MNILSIATAVHWIIEGLIIYFIVYSEYRFFKTRKTPINLAIAYAIMTFIVVTITLLGGLPGGAIDAVVACGLALVLDYIVMFWQKIATGTRGPT